MKIGQLNSNQSFGKLVINAKDASRTQRKIINRVLDSSHYSPQLISDLENQGTDLYICADKDKKSVHLSLLTDCDFMGLKMVPVDSLGNRIEATLNHHEINGELRSCLALIRFLNQAKKLNVLSPKNIDIYSETVYGKK